MDVRELDVKRDNRGWFAEVLRGTEIPQASFGQLYLSVAAPGAVRGNHYHTRKTEWFCIVAGSAELALLDTATGQRACVLMGEEHMVTVRIPPNVAHALRNTGDTPAYLVAYVDEEYDPSDPDTFPAEVIV